MAKPTIDRQAAEQINLSVLKRLDPQVEELLATAGHVALYDFDVANTRWARKDVEGSLFLVKRNGSPRFRIVILNKKSADNYVEDVGGGFQCELNPPYLLYRNKAGEVVGVWFYEEADCNRIAELINRISSTFAAPSDAEAGAVAAGAPPAAIQQQPEAVEAEEEADEDDGVFWDKRVEVPAEVEMPGRQAPAAVAEQPPAAAQNGGSGGSSGQNLLSMMFGGMRVGSAESKPAAAAEPAVAAVPLLTPQFLQQQAAAAPVVAAAAAAPPPAPQENQGALLLQTLRAAAPPPATTAVAASDGGQVAALLRALAANEKFCAELSKEMRAQGML